MSEYQLAIMVLRRRIIELRANLGQETMAKEDCEKACNRHEGNIGGIWEQINDIQGAIDLLNPPPTAEVSWADSFVRAGGYRDCLPRKADPDDMKVEEEAAKLIKGAKR